MKVLLSLFALLLILGCFTQGAAQLDPIVIWPDPYEGCRDCHSGFPHRQVMKKHPKISQFDLEKIKAFSPKK